MFITLTTDLGTQSHGIADYDTTSAARVLEETTRRVLACDSDHLLVQAVVCHCGQQPPLSGAGHLDSLKVP